MKKEYVKPVMEREVFVANEYVANCATCQDYDPNNRYQIKGPNNEDLGVGAGCGATVRTKDGSTLYAGSVVYAADPNLVLVSVPTQWASFAETGYHHFVSVSNTPS